MLKIHYIPVIVSELKFCKNFREISRSEQTAADRYIMSMYEEGGPRGR